MVKHILNYFVNDRSESTMASQIGRLNVSGVAAINARAQCKSIAVPFVHSSRRISGCSIKTRSSSKIVSVPRKASSSG